MSALPTPLKAALDKMLLQYYAQSPVFRVQEGMSVRWRVGHVGYSAFMRVGPRYLDHTRRDCCVIASIQTTTPGKGGFTKLLPELEEWAESKGLGLYVEQVLTPRFAEFWRRRGYGEIDYPQPHFYRLPTPQEVSSDGIPSHP